MENLCNQLSLKNKENIINDEMYYINGEELGIQHKPFKSFYKVVEILPLIIGYNIIKKLIIFN